jgi:diamine N-acetyltransferase
LIPLYLRWRNDFAVARTMDHVPAPMTMETRREWYERISHDPATVAFTLFERATWRPIGLTNFHDIDNRHGTAEFGLILGEADARGRGYGTEVTRLMLDYAFTALGLKNVMLRVYEFNRGGLRAYEKAGFREIGRRRMSHFMGGRWWDVIFMDCLASEISSPVLHRVCAPDIENEQ